MLEEHFITDECKGNKNGEHDIRLIKGGDVWCGNVGCKMKWLPKKEEDFFKSAKNVKLTAEEKDEGRRRLTKEEFAESQTCKHEWKTYIDPLGDPWMSCRVCQWKRELMVKEEGRKMLDGSLQECYHVWNGEGNFCEICNEKGSLQKEGNEYPVDDCMYPQEEKCSCYQGTECAYHKELTAKGIRQAGEIDFRHKMESYYTKEECDNKIWDECLKQCHTCHVKISDYAKEERQFREDLLEWIWRIYQCSDSSGSEVLERYEDLRRCYC